MNFDQFEQFLLTLLPGQFSITSVDLVSSSSANEGILGTLDLTAAEQGISWVSDIEELKAIRQQRAWILLWYPYQSRNSVGVAASSLQACVDAVRLAARTVG